MLDSEMIEDKGQGMNNRLGGNAPLIAEKIADRVNSEKQQRLF